MAELGPTLSSPQNPRIKYARSLLRRKDRNRERAFLVEGVTAVVDALESGAVPELLFVQADRLDARLGSLVESAVARGTRVFPVAPEVFATLASTETPQGLIGVFRFPTIEIQPSPDEAPLILVADSISDPGNLGTMLRSTLGSGAHALLHTTDSVDPYSPKVVRAAMGAHFRLPIRAFRWDQGNELLASCRQRLVCDANAQLSYDRVDLTVSTAIIVGNESRGPSPGAQAAATGAIRIPLAGGLESLNAAVAASVVLFDASRQRRAQSLRK